MATLLLHADDADLSRKNLNVFTLFRFFRELGKQLQAEGAGVDYCRRRQLGGFLIKMRPNTDDLTEKICQLDNVYGHAVTVEMPLGLNMIRGVVTHPELEYIDADELKEVIGQEEQVAYVKKSPTSSTAVLGWSLGTHKSLPATVTLGWDRVRVRTYVPRPTRCYRCQDYGHIAEACTDSPTCARCAEEHMTEDCPDKPAHCCYCEGAPHQASSPDCPEWQRRVAIQKIKTRGKMTYRQALLKYEEEEEKKNEDEKKEDKTQENKKKEDEKEEEKKEDQKKEDDSKQEDKKTVEEERPTLKRPAQDTDEPDNADNSQLDQSGSVPDNSGGWRKVSSRRKKK